MFPVGPGDAGRRRGDFAVRQIGLFLSGQIDFMRFAVNDITQDQRYSDPDDAHDDEHPAPAKGRHKPVSTSGAMAGPSLEPQRPIPVGSPRSRDVKPIPHDANQAGRGVFTQAEEHRAPTNCQKLPTSRPTPAPVTRPRCRRPASCGVRGGRQVLRREAERWHRPRGTPIAGGPSGRS